MFILQLYLWLNSGFLPCRSNFTVHRLLLKLIDLIFFKWSHICFHLRKVFFLESFRCFMFWKWNEYPEFFVTLTVWLRRACISVDSEKYSIPYLRRTILLCFNEFLIKYVIFSQIEWSSLFSLPILMSIWTSWFHEFNSFCIFPINWGEIIMSARHSFLETLLLFRTGPWFVLVLTCWLLEKKYQG